MTNLQKTLAKLAKSNTVIRQEYVVFDKNDSSLRIGHGFGFYDSKGVGYGPFLFNNDDSPMVSGFYNIQLLGDEMLIVVGSRRIN